jgi:hypothetical protein
MSDESIREALLRELRAKVPSPGAPPPDPPKLGASVTAALRALRDVEARRREEELRADRRTLATLVVEERGALERGALERNEPAALRTLANAVEELATHPGLTLEQGTVSGPAAYRVLTVAGVRWRRLRPEWDEAEEVVGMRRNIVEHIAERERWAR